MSVTTSETVVVDVCVVVIVEVESGESTLYVVETYGGGRTVMASRVEVRTDVELGLT